MISVILPTYNEVENIEIIISKLIKVFEIDDIDGEIIVVDDNSNDGTAFVAEALSKQYPVKVFVRKTDRGLSKSVVKGFELAQGEVCVVMDADLSHPVEKISDMINPIIKNECDMTVGSRNVPGGGCKEWPFSRRAISSIAGFMAKGVTPMSDPTSGFMAVRKSILDNVSIDPLGWKIVLEIAVKAQPRIREIPILFADREKGTSKLSIKTQMDYLTHLWRLYSFKYVATAQFIRFCVVGFSGLLIDTAVLICLVEYFSFDPRFATVFAFYTAVSWNYFFNRLWTFGKLEKTKIIHTYISFIMICIIGLGIRVGVMHILIKYAGMDESPWYIIASLLGIALATVVNFLGSRQLVFSGLFRK